jgi:hypothetical protein
MLPFEGERVEATPNEHRRVQVNLVPYNLRWDHDGMDRARIILQNTADKLESDGWMLVSSLQAQGTLLAGRTAAGRIVSGGIMQLVRVEATAEPPKPVTRPRSRSIRAA